MNGCQNYTVFKIKANIFINYLVEVLDVRSNYSITIEYPHNLYLVSRMSTGISLFLCSRSTGKLCSLGNFVSLVKFVILGMMQGRSFPCGF